jgi:uncharacterized RDD family membrane protein YckC
MDGSAATQAAWRSEVKNRVKTYRDRRRTLANDDSQTALEFEREPDEGPQADSEDQCKPEILSAGHEEYDQRVDHLFDEAADTAGAHDEEQYEDPLQATLAAAARMSHEESAAPEHVREEPLQQLMIDVSRPPEVEPTPTAEKFAISYGNIDSHLESTLFPVGDLRTRRRAGMLDAMALLLSYAAILGLFAAFGGRLAPVRLDAFICGSIAALLYVQYFVLFSMLGGATPGMMMTALRVVGFDGSAPKPRQLMMRGVGYVISGGMAMLGFLWAFWDEDHLSWHDRISQTYIISAEDLSKAISAAEAPDEPPLAQF